MLKRIGKTIAMFEILDGNENIFIRGNDTYKRAIDCTFYFRRYGGGYCFNETQFFIEIEDNEEIWGAKK